MNKNPAFRRGAFSLACLMGLSVASAETWEWTAESGLWNNPANWDLGFQPGSGVDTILRFGGSGDFGFTSTNDYFGAFQLNGLEFDSDRLGTVTIDTNSGGILSFIGDGLTNPHLTQDGSGAVNVMLGIELANPLTLGGTGTGLVTLGGAITGTGGLFFTGGNWRLANTGNSFTGGMTILTGASVELASGAAAPQGVAFAVAGNSLAGGNSAANPLTIDGGTLKLTTSGNGSITFGGGRPVTFGASGGVLDLRNVNTTNSAQQGGHITGGDLNVTVNSAAATPAVVRFSGGQFGHSNNSATDGNWNVGANVLRFSGFNGTGALRVELTNGAMLRAGNGGGSPQNISLQTTWRGVVGGDPTSGPLGTVNTGLSTNTGRVAIDVTEITYANLTLEGALQIGLVGASRALSGNIVVAGTASGAPGYIVFDGRGTNTQLTSVIQAPGANGGTASQHPLWLLRNNAGSLTIQDGGVAVLDPRVRTDTSGTNGNGVAMDGQMIIQAGGNVVVSQSVSNFTPGITATAANVGDIIIYGDITGTGNTEKDAVFSIALPAPQAGSPVISTIPATLTTTATVAGERPYGGLRFDDSRGTANFIVNGTGFGGLRINGIARPNALLSSTGAVGGAPMADPVGADVKVASALTATRLSRLTGTGGYLTVAPENTTYAFPAGGEWANNVPVGLKAVNHNAGGVDVSLANLSGFNHNVAVASGATLDFGTANPFVIGNNATIHGTGTLLSSGNVVVSPGASISPGFDNLGTFSFAGGGTLTLEGGLQIGVQNTLADRLDVEGNLVLGGSAIFSGSFGTEELILASYTGNLTGQFSNLVGLAPVYILDYGTGLNSVIRLIYNDAPALVWEGAPTATWSNGGGNWKGGATFVNGEKVRFDNTATGSTTVTITGGNVEPLETAVHAETGGYTIISSPGAALAGTGQLVKTGAEILTLIGAATYSGGTVINAGTVALGSADALPDEGTVSIAAGATLDMLGKTDFIGDLVVNGSVVGGGSLAADSVSLGSGAVFEPDLMLSGPLNKTGTVASTIASAVDLNGTTRTINVSGGSTLSLTGVLTNGGINKAGDGDLVLTPVVPNQLFEPTTVSGGRLIANPGAIPADSIVNTASGATLDLTFGGPISLLALNNSGTFNILGNQPLTLGQLSGTGGSINGANGIELIQTATTTYNGSITGTTAVIMNGLGAITLGGASNYSGGLFVNTGRVVLTHAAAGGSGTVHVVPGAQLGSSAGLTSRVELSGGTFFALGSPGSAASNDFVAMAGTTSTISLQDPNNAGVRSQIFIPGTLKGSGDLNVIVSTNTPHPDGGVGFRLVGTGASDYSGTISVGRSAKVEVQTTQAGPFSPAGTGKFVFEAGNFTGGLNGTYSQINIRSNFAGNTIIGNDIEIVGSGMANMNLPGSAPLDSRVTMGQLRIGDQMLGVNRNGTPSQILEFTSVVLTGQNANFAPNTPGFGASGSSDLRLGAISEVAPGASITMSGQSVLELVGVNSYTGSTFIQSGTVRLGAPGALPPSTELIVDGGILDFNSPLGSFDQQVASLSGSVGVITNGNAFNVQTLAVFQETDTIFSGSLSGNLALNKAGAGKLTMNGPLTNIGEVTVDGGVLALNSTVTPIVVAQNSGVLSGNGSLGTVFIRNGGGMAPGSILGAGRIAGAEVTFDPTTYLRIDLGKATPGAQPVTGDHDVLHITGTVDLGAAALILELGSGIEQGDIFTVLLNDGPVGINGNFSDLANGDFLVVNGQPFQISYFDDASTPDIFELAGGNDVSLLAVPEPGSAALLLGGLALLAGARRRRG